MKIYKMNQKVIVPHKWQDPTFVCKGIIMGVEKLQDGYYLGTRGLTEYKSRFTRHRYKVIYESYGRVHEEWFSDSALDSANG